MLFSYSDESSMFVREDSFHIEKVANINEIEILRSNDQVHCHEEACLDSLLLDEPTVKSKNENLLPVQAP